MAVLRRSYTGFQKGTQTQRWTHVSPSCYYVVQIGFEWKQQLPRTISQRLVVPVDRFNSKKKTTLVVVVIPLEKPVDYQNQFNRNSLNVHMWRHNVLCKMSECFNFIQATRVVGWAKKIFFLTLYRANLASRAHKKKKRKYSLNLQIAHYTSNIKLFLNISQISQIFPVFNQ